jgi:hypothetical protein
MMMAVDAKRIENNLANQMEAFTVLHIDKAVKYKGGCSSKTRDRFTTIQNKSSEVSREKASSSQIKRLYPNHTSRIKNPIRTTSSLVHL